MSPGPSLSPVTEAHVVGIVLAAGGSTRMGRPKGLLELGGEPLLLHHLRVLGAACASVRVVLGRHHAELLPVLDDLAEVVDNPDWAETGPRESLALALEHPEPLPDRARVLVTPVDVPPAPAEVVAALLAAGPLAVPVFRGQRGHPVVVQVGAARLGLRHATLREILACAVEVPVDWPDLAVDFDTPDAWAHWLDSQTPAPGQPHG